MNETSSPVDGDAGRVIVNAPPLVFAKIWAPAWIVSAAEITLQFLVSWSLTISVAFAWQIYELPSHSKKPVWEVTLKVNV